MRKLNKVLVTGGAGFIGSAFIRFLLKNPEFSGKIYNFDVLTYAADLNSLKGFHTHPRYRFLQGNILHQELLEERFLEWEIDTVVHFAAETHVDRSIQSAGPFIETNVKGTLSLLEAIRKFPEIHLHHVSTDEVYGSLGESGTFDERSPYRPNSPYAASKAASDHLVRVFAHTYGISTTISHCSNNYGPYQNREKLIPRMLSKCLKKEPLPIYGNGAHVRDWLFVDDHVEAIWAILQKGKRKETYAIGARQEQSNLSLIHLLIEELERQKPGEEYRSLIRFTSDRAGHDFRYAIDPSKLEIECGWKAKISLQEGMKRTVAHFRRRFSEL